MLKLISWNQYFLFVIVVAAVWYAYVLLRFAAKPAGTKSSSFSAKDRTTLMGGLQELPEEHLSANGMAIPEAVEDEGQDLGLITQTVIQEIKGVITEAAGQGISDEDLVAEVRVALSNYPELKSTAYGSMVIECIVREGQAVGFEWTVEEVESFWN